MAASFSYAAIDFETTGSVAGYPVEPWQVGVARVEPGASPVCWESLLRIGDRPFHPRAPGRHAALRGALERAPGLPECLDRLREHCAGVPLVAHNTATERNCLARDLPMERFGPWIDTLKLSRAAWPELSSHRLGDLLARFGLMEKVRTAFPDREPHDALFDAYGSHLLLKFLLEQPGWESVELEVLVSPDLGGYYRKPIR